MAVVNGHDDLLEEEAGVVLFQPIAAVRRGGLQVSKSPSVERSDRPSYHKCVLQPYLCYCQRASSLNPHARSVRDCLCSIRQRRAHDVLPCWSSSGSYTWHHHTKRAHLQASLGSDMGEEVAAGRVLHDDREVLVGEEALLEAHDVWVDEHGVVEQLPLHILCHLALHACRENCGKVPNLPCVQCKDMQALFAGPQEDGRRIAQADRMLLRNNQGTAVLPHPSIIVHCVENLVMGHLNEQSI